MKNNIENKQVNSELLEFSVLKNGIVNNYDKAWQEYSLALEEYKKTKNEDAKKIVEGAKEKLKVEIKKINDEVRQISKLNKKPKGDLLFEKENDVILRVNKVNKIYASKRNIFEALKNAELTFKRGSFNVILGPSGSGKTTLLNMISGLDRATTGEVIIDGVNIQALTSREMTKFRRNNIGFVFQSYNLLPSLNVKDNIEVGRSLQSDNSRKQDIDKLLNEMEMLHNRKKMTYELSGGQQQRVSIARALSKSPTILIGDEPTGALDGKTAAKVFQLFQKVNEDFQTTVIIVTHNPKVAELANQVIHVKDGLISKVVMNDSPKKASSFEEI